MSTSKRSTTEKKPELVTVLEFARRRNLNAGSRAFIYQAIEEKLIIPNQYIARGDVQSPLIDWEEYKEFPLTKAEKEKALNKHLKKQFK